MRSDFNIYSPWFVSCVGYWARLRRARSRNSCLYIDINSKSGRTLNVHLVSNYRLAGDPLEQRGSVVLPAVSSVCRGGHVLFSWGPPRTAGQRCPSSRIECVSGRTRWLASVQVEEVLLNRLQLALVQSGPKLGYSLPAAGCIQDEIRWKFWNQMELFHCSLYNLNTKYTMCTTCIDIKPRRVSALMLLYSKHSVFRNNTYCKHLLNWTSINCSDNFINLIFLP